MLHVYINTLDNYIEPNMLYRPNIYMYSTIKTGTRAFISVCIISVVICNEKAPLIIVIVICTG